MLVSSAGVSTLQVVTGSRQSPHPKYYVGEGKAQEIAQAVQLAAADIVIFNHALSPAQERNLESLCKCRVLRSYRSDPRYLCSTRPNTRR